MHNPFSHCRGHGRKDRLPLLSHNDQHHLYILGMQNVWISHNIFPYLQSQQLDHFLISALEISQFSSSYSPFVPPTVISLTRIIGCPTLTGRLPLTRSEERRVGKE